MAIATGFTRWGTGCDDDWGQVPVVPHATHVASREPAGFLARYDFGFSELSLAANEAKGLLIIASYSTFRDGSGAIELLHQGILLSRKERSLIMITASIGADGDLIGRAASLARERSPPAPTDMTGRRPFPPRTSPTSSGPGCTRAAVPRSHGGHGLGPDAGLFTLWMMTKELAKADMALARCWEGHVNSQMLLNALGDDRQKDRWFEGIVERGEIWAAWSGEPQARIPGQTARFGTVVRPTQGGYLVDGTKVFATSSRVPRWAILLVNLHGPGGARHSQAADGLLLLACDLTDPSVQFDESLVGSRSGCAGR